MENASLNEAAKCLAAAQQLLFLSGAGISAESGVPTFRGKDGLWRNYRAEDLATPEAFARNPALVWEWYNWRKALVAQCQPNAAHFAVVELAKLLPHCLFVTQNVDGLHRAAGLDNVLEMHGNLYRTRCTVCGALEEKREDVTPEVRCTHCGGVPLRPDVVWFGEAIPPTTLKTIYDKLSVADAILVVGTSGTVYPAAGFAVEVRRRGGTVIEINTESPHGHYPRDIFLQGKAGTVLPQLVAQLKSQLQIA